MTRSIYPAPSRKTQNENNTFSSLDIKISRIERILSKGDDVDYEYVNDTFWNFFKKNRYLFASVVGMIVFWNYYIDKFFELIPSIVISLLGFAMVLFLIPKYKEISPEDFVKEEIIPGVSRKSLYDSMLICYTSSKKLLQLSQRFSEFDLNKLSVILEKIGDNYEEDPSDILQSNFFLDHYLPDLLKVIDGYVQVSESYNQEDQRIISMRDDINGFISYAEEFHSSIKENDWSKLELTSQTLKQMVKHFS